MIVEGKIYPYKRTVNRLFKTASEVLGEDFSNVNVSINFVGESEIKDLNNKFRQIDKVTDVLSFPNLEKEACQKLVDFDHEKDDQNMLFVGDIVICKEKAKSQAKEYGHSNKREICFLALHGLLHLLGFDHIEKNDEILMQKTAEEILSKFGVKR